MLRRGTSIVRQRYVPTTSSTLRLQSDCQGQPSTTLAQLRTVWRQCRNIDTQSAVAIARRLRCACRQFFCLRDVWHTSCFTTGRSNANDERTFWDERLQNSSNALCSTLRAGAGYSFCATVGTARDSGTEHSVCAKPDGSAGRGTTA